MLLDVLKFSKQVVERQLKDSEEGFTTQHLVYIKRIVAETVSKHRRKGARSKIQMAVFVAPA